MEIGSSGKHKNIVGFTLIELLVVIAIIAVLAAILFPAFAQVREKARATACLSNLKQIGLGLMQYSQDYDEQLPPAWIGYDPDPAKSIAFPGKARWMDVIQPFVKSTEIFTCPDSNTKYVPVPNDKKVSDTDPATGQAYANENGGYAMNVAYFWDANANPPTPIPDVSGKSTRSLASLPDPSGTMYVFDFKNNPTSFQCVWATINGWWPNPQIVNTVHPRTLGANGWLVELHQDRFNTLFCDGHAKVISLDYATQLATSGPTAGAYCHFTIEDDCN